MENHIFISAEDFKLYAPHPGDEQKGWKKEVFKCRFTNSQFTTKNPQCVEAIENHPHFGRRIFPAPESIKKVENKYLPEKQTLADALAGMSISILRGIAKERSLTDWDRLKNMKKDELVEFMVEHKDKLGHYATVGH